jgi:excisionase family DNA binding protein
MTSREPLLTVAEVADQLRLDPETIRRWAREGRIKAIALPSGLWRFRRSDVEDLLRGEADAEVAR